MTHHQSPDQPRRDSVQLRRQWQYGAANQLLQITYGDEPANFYGGTETRTYNSLLQLTGISSQYVSMQYNYNAGQNNGKIASAVNYNLSGEQVVYTYDSLNRLIQAQTAANPSVTQWGQAFVYDGFGNLYQKNVTAGSAPSMSYSVNESTNQLNGLGYDANGNVTNPPTGGTLTYDFLNRVVAGTGGVQYSYDASNRRVWKLNANGEAYYLYDLNGENLGTFTPQIEADPTSLYLQPVAWQERAYFFGKKLFVAEDNVGSALASSPSTRSFYPYGEPKSGTAATEQYAFATYWEDSETGLDYAMNRYYSSTLGRFLTPDPYGGSMNPKSPQSFNRYAYAGNDPANGNDPIGLDSYTGAASYDSSTETIGAFCATYVQTTWDQYSGWPDDGGFSMVGSVDTYDIAMSACEQMVNSYLAAMSGGAGGSGAPAANILSNNTLAVAGEFQTAFDAAWKALEQPQCASVFEPDAGDSATDFAQAELAQTDYRILPFPSDQNTTGAQTVGNNVTVNLNGAFFTAQEIFGVVDVFFPSPNSPGVQDGVSMTLVDFQAALILHELGHETGVFGPDTSSTVNGGYSNQVLENCFGISLP